MLRFNRQTKSKREIMMSHDYSILSLFEITDGNINVQSVSKIKTTHSQHVHVINASLTYDRSRCSHCGKSALIKNGFRLSKIRLPTINGGNYELHLRRQRFYCKKCHHTQSASTNIVVANQTFSRQLKHTVMELLRESLPATTIAKLCGISPSSVIRILQNDVHLPNALKELPPHLCFDEFRSADKLMSFNCCDSVSHKRVALIFSRLSKDITEHFINRYSLSQRQKVETVVIDMNAEYASFIKQIFPNAVIIIDRFHIVQLAGKALDSERLCAIELFKETERRLYRIGKSQWRLFHLDAKKVNAEKSHYLKGVNEYMTQQNAIDLLLQKSPSFSKSYDFYQCVLHALRDEDPTVIADLIDNYQPQGTNMDTVVRTYQKNRAGILNACRYKYSNGPIEGMNRKIKALKRSCYGFRNIKNFFLRISLIYA